MLSCVESFPTDSVVARYKIPDSIAEEVGGGWFSIGMRCVNGVVSLYYNDIKLVDFPAYRGAISFTQRPSPVILLNGGCYCAFDNVTVSTPDYDLFNEGAAAVVTPVDTTPAGGDDSQPANEPDETEKVIETKVETKVVEDTNEAGEIVTRIETEIVTEEVVRPAPDTGNASQGGGNQGGGTSARTGDAAIIVVAVMITALGAAIVVKKVTSK